MVTFAMEPGSPVRDGTRNDAIDATKEAIRNDVERTFSDIPMVASRKAAISAILQEYAMDNPDIGYTQGMNYIAATMVLKYPDRQPLAKRRFAEAMLTFGGLWSDGFPLMNYGFCLFEHLACKYLTALWNHLVRSGVELSSYLPNGWLSLFGKWLPLPAVMQVMDFALECGIRGLIAVTLAIFHIQQSRLLRADGMERLLELINQDMRTSPLDGELVVKCSRQWLTKVDEALPKAAMS